MLMILHTYGKTSAQLSLIDMALLTHGSSDGPMVGSNVGIAEQTDCRG